MTPEKREKAIAFLNDEIRSLRLAPTINGCEMKPEWAEQLEIMETCLEAVKVCSVDTNKTSPLTLEHLREMDGQPVWGEFEDGSGGLWGIVHVSVFEQIVFPNGLHCTIGHPYYGKIYKAYAYPPAHIDREAWTAEWTVDEFGHKCSKCGEYLPDGEIGWKPQFCPSCGRAMTPDAWAELKGENNA